jgi:predicted ATP-grasp superfamily ATP-dependent carboligase
VTSRNEAGAALIPALDAGGSLACVRSLGRRGVPTILLAHDRSSPVLQSRYVTECVDVPSPYTAYRRYRDAVLDVAAREDVTTLVPLRDVDVHLLQEARDALAEHLSLPVASTDQLRTASDRVRLFDAAPDADVAGPETALLDEWTDWDQRLVVKPRYGIVVDGDNAGFSSDPEFFAGERPDVDALTERMGHVPIVQSYVPGGPEQGFFALFDNGEPVATFQHHRVRSYSYDGGASVYRRSIRNDDVAAAGLRLLSHLDWHGPAMVEFRRDERDGTLQLLEVNPRFWGSLALPVHAGVDFPWLYYQLACGEQPERVETYRVGVGSHVLVGELSYLHSVATDDHEHQDAPSLPREVSRVLRSLVTDPQFDVLSARDPKPFLGTTSQLLGEYLW